MRLIGFTEVESESALRAELRKEGKGVGDATHKERFAPEEVGR
jgi:hypothetical protein